MAIQKYVKDNMQEYRVYRQRLLSEALDTMCHWIFHAPVSERNNSTEFCKSVQFLEQYHRGILRLYINYAHDFRAK